jgi:hypothetical protein
MSNLNTLVNEIMTAGLNTSGKEWVELYKLINSKPEEFIIFKLEPRISLISSKQRSNLYLMSNRSLSLIFLTI